MPEPKRPYRQTARALASEALRGRIIHAFHDLLLNHWIDEIALDAVAEAAGTTRQTIIRLFGGKSGVLDAVIKSVWAKAEPRIALAAGTSRTEALGVLMAHYEAVGDVTIRFLAQEARHPALGEPLARGRREHRDWVAAQFAADLPLKAGPAWDRLVTQLVVATDIYTWKLLRRDLGHGAADVARIIGDMINALREGARDV